MCATLGPLAVSITVGSSSLVVVSAVLVDDLLLASRFLPIWLDLAGPAV